MSVRASLYVNAAAWIANAVVWFPVNKWMSVAAAAAALASLYAARKS